MSLRLLRNWKEGEKAFLVMSDKNADFSFYEKFNKQWVKIVEVDLGIEPKYLIQATRYDSVEDQHVTSEFLVYSDELFYSIEQAEEAKVM